jgi:hypothetical protein
MARSSWIGFAAIWNQRYCSAGLPKAHFQRASLLSLPELPPPGFELLDIVPMDGGFATRRQQLVRRKPRALSKSLVDEIQGAVLQSGH